MLAFGVLRSLLLVTGFVLKAMGECQKVFGKSWGLDLLTHVQISKKCVDRRPSSFKRFVL